MNLEELRDTALALCKPVTPETKLTPVEVPHLEVIFLMQAQATLEQNDLLAKIRDLHIHDLAVREDQNAILRELVRLLEHRNQQTDALLLGEEYSAVPTCLEEPTRFTMPDTYQEALRQGLIHEDDAEVERA